MKTFECKKKEDGTGDGHAAWQALNEKYNTYTEKARRPYHEKLNNTKMEPGQDSDDLFFVLDGCRDLLEEMGQTSIIRTSFCRLSLQSMRGYETLGTRSGTLD